MPRGGQNRKPMRLKLLQGTARPGRQRPGPKPRPVAPARPRWLKGEARREWDRVAPELERLGLLTVVDCVAFAIYCESWASWREYKEIIAREGLVIEGYRQAPRKHPLLPALHQAEQAVRAFGQEFGLTPASRGRLDLPPPEDDDDFDLD